MSDKTHIQWCDATFNPWIGCTKVSPGCANCYAERNRATVAKGIQWGKGRERQRNSESTWKDPVAWNRAPWKLTGDGHDFYSWRQVGRRPRVFCASLADWLDDEVPIEWLCDLLKLIHETPNLDWLLLTKRPENWEAQFAKCQLELYKQRSGTEGMELWLWLCDWLNDRVPPHNVWFGVSVEDQARAEERIPQLLRIPARVRFLSVEPMLGPVNFDVSGSVSEPVSGTFRPTHSPTHSLTGIDWVIFGGESGPKARPCNIEWIRDGVRQCRAAGVAPFVKQLGSNVKGHWDGPTPKAYVTGSIISPPGVILRDSKGGEPSEWPEDLRVRESPKAV